MIMSESICFHCIFYGYEPAHISAHPEDDYPESCWCEEGMDENFETEGGCYCFARRREEDE